MIGKKTKIREWRGLVACPTFRFVWTCFAGVVLLAAGACTRDPSDQPRPSPAKAEIDVTPRTIPAIPPGTEITDGPPQGWTHLVLKSQPRLGAEAAEQVSETMARLVSLLYTAIVADVQLEEDPRPAARFYLAKVAAGVGTEVGGRQIILSSDTQQELGADLDFLDRRALGGGEDHVQQIRCVARSRTMAILDAPNLLVRDGKHRRMVLRYAILVDPNTGRLDTLLWLLEPEADDRYAGPLGPAQWLPESKLADCRLHVDTDEYILGVPTTAAFAMVHVPQGRQTLVIPETLEPIAAAARLTPTSARELEQLLGALLTRPRT